MFHKPRGNHLTKNKAWILALGCREGGTLRSMSCENDRSPWRYGAFNLQGHCQSASSDASVSVENITYITSGWEQGRHLRPTRAAHESWEHMPLIHRGTFKTGIHRPASSPLHPQREHHRARNLGSKAGILIKCHTMAFSKGGNPQRKSEWFIRTLILCTHCTEPRVLFLDFGSQRLGPPRQGNLGFIFGSSAGDWLFLGGGYKWEDQYSMSPSRRRQGLQSRRNIPVNKLQPLVESGARGPRRLYSISLPKRTTLRNRMSKGKTRQSLMVGGAGASLIQAKSPRFPHGDYNSSIKRNKVGGIKCFPRGRDYALSELLPFILEVY